MRDVGLPDDDEGAGGPGWLRTLAQLFIAAALLLAMPRQWIAAGAALAVGATLAGVHRWRRRGSDRAPARTDITSPSD